MDGYCWMPIDNSWVADDVEAAFNDNLDVIRQINNYWLCPDAERIAFHRQCLEEIRSML